MGFLDKAKKLAEQAQQKIDETQNKFNEQQQAAGSSHGTGAVQYDKFGRPIPQEQSEVAPQPSVPSADFVEPEQPQQEVQPDPATPSVPDQAAPEPSSSTAQKPGMTSGDPLAG